MIPDMHGVEAVMVTSEPEGGSEAPTSAPIVIVAVRERSPAREREDVARRQRP